MTQKAFWMCSFPNMDLFPKFDIISKLEKYFGPKENIVPQNLGSHINTVKASEPL